MTRSREYKHIARRHSALAPMAISPPRLDSSPMAAYLISLPQRQATPRQSPQGCQHEIHTIGRQRQARGDVTTSDVSLEAAE